MNIKVLYNKNGKYGEELAISLDNRITFLDNMFDNTLGCMDKTFEEYKKFTIEEKIDDLISSVIDGYYYNGNEVMDKYFIDNFNRNLNEFEIIEETEIDKRVVLDLINFSTEEKFMKEYQNEIIKNLKTLNLI